MFRNGLSERVAAKKLLFAKGNRMNGTDMLNLTKIGMKIRGKEYYGVTNKSWKLLGQIADNL